MKISKYIKFVDEVVENSSALQEQAGKSNNEFYSVRYIDNEFSDDIPDGVTAVIVDSEVGLKFYTPRHLKFDFIFNRAPDEIKYKHSLNWIRTKNLLFNHIMKSITELQSEFIKTLDKSRLVPISLSEFVSKYPYDNLDISRLSRLAGNNWIQILNSKISYGKKYLLRDFFCSRKEVYSNIVEQIITDNAYQNRKLKDSEIKRLLRERYGVDISTRTICNYRQSKHLPAYNKTNLVNPYYAFFSGPIRFTKDNLCFFPCERGVYELSIAGFIKYPKYVSGILYLGQSKNLFRRLQSYFYNISNNSTIQEYIKTGIFIRYMTTERSFEIEQELLKRFFLKYGSLPLANKLPKWRIK